MKKILSLIVVLAVAVTGFAQAPLAKTSTTRVFADTNTNATQKYLYTPILKSNNLTSVEYTGTKLSGFIKGSVAFQYLADTSGFAAGTASWTTYADSLTLSNSTTNTKIWPAVGHARYMRLRITTIDSTQSLRSTGQYIAK